MIKQIAELKHTQYDVDVDYFSKIRGSKKAYVWSRDEVRSFPYLNDAIAYVKDLTGDRRPKSKVYRDGPPKRDGEGGLPNIPGAPQPEQAYHVTPIDVPKQLPHCYHIGYIYAWVEPDQPHTLTEVWVCINRVSTMPVMWEG
jgi:hypothetical protein